MRSRLYLARILGSRMFIAFLCVSLLVVALLSSVNFASRFAMKTYVDDQLDKMAWDVVGYQHGDNARMLDVSEALSLVIGIERAFTTVGEKVVAFIHEIVAEEKSKATI